MSEEKSIQIKFKKSFTPLCQKCVCEDNSDDDFYDYDDDYCSDAFTPQSILG